MAQDLKNLFEDQSKEQTAKMSKGHEARFLQKLDKALPKQKKTNRFGFLNIAASIVVLLGLSYGAYQFISGPNTCLLYTSPSPRDRQKSRMPSSA